jgi:hypothetical protein
MEILTAIAVVPACFGLALAIEVGALKLMFWALKVKP